MRTLFALLLTCALVTAAQAQPTTAAATSTIENPDGGQCGSCCAHHARAEGADASAGCCAGMHEGQTEASGHGGGMACCAGMHREGEEAVGHEGMSCCGSGASCCSGGDAEGESGCCGRMQHGDAGTHEGHDGMHEQHGEAPASKVAHAGAHTPAEGHDAGCCCAGDAAPQSDDAGQ